MNRWSLASLLILVTVLAYLPAMNGEFVWDDDMHLTDNIVLKEDGLYRVWFTTDSTNYWPVTFSSYWIEYQFWGLDSTGFHVTNLVIHILCTLFIWHILHQLDIPGAWLASLVFAIHPVNVESVAWITQRKNLLSLLFYLVALTIYLRFDRRGNRWWYWLSLFAFAVALLSKSHVVVLPVVLLLCIWWLRGSISRKDLYRSLPFFACALAIGTLEIWFQNKTIDTDNVREHSFWERLALAGWAFWFYLSKVMLPMNLCFVYPRWEIDPMNWLSYVPGVLLVGSFWILWRHRRYAGKSALFAFGYYLIT